MSDDSTLDKTESELGNWLSLEIQGRVAAILNLAHTREGQIEARLFVTAPFRRKGIGSALLAISRSLGRESGAKRLRFDCNRNDWAMRGFLLKHEAVLDLVADRISAYIHC